MGKLLLMAGSGQVRWSQLSAEAERLDLEPQRVDGAWEALSVVKTQPVAVVVVDGQTGEADGGVSLSGLFRECCNRGVSLLFLGTDGEFPAGAWGIDSPYLLDILPPLAPAPQLRARIAFLAELQRLREEIDQKNLEIEVLHQELAELSSLDNETGLFGRRYFFSHLDKEWRQAERIAAPLVLLRLEIDGFVEHLERHGREEATACLCSVAQALYSCLLRPNDLLARYDEGGFAILLPDTETAGWQEVAGRLRRAVAELAAPEGDGMVTLSIGCALRPPGGGDKVVQNGEAFLQLAEDALARARAEGGDRVVIHVASPAVA